MIRKLLFAAPVLAVMTCLALLAQEGGQWRASSPTAKAITGDVSFSDIKFIVNFNGYTIAQIRSLTPTEITALFHTDAPADALGNLYRTDIPAEKHFSHKNTLCGSEDTQWLLTYVHGKTLQIAMFSGNDIPTLTADALANPTSLCGTYSYVR